MSTLAGYAEKLSESRFAIGNFAEIPAFVGNIAISGLAAIGSVGFTKEHMTSNQGVLAVVGAFVMARCFDRLQENKHNFKC